MPDAFSKAKNQPICQFSRQPSEIMPGLKRAAIMFNPNTAPYASTYLPSRTYREGQFRVTREGQFRVTLKGRLALRIRDHLR
jgi:hypothetical protein